MALVNCRSCDNPTLDFGEFCVHCGRGVGYPFRPRFVSGCGMEIFPIFPYPHNDHVENWHEWFLEKYSGDLLDKVFCPMCSQQLKG